MNDIACQATSAFVAETKLLVYNDFYSHVYLWGRKWDNVMPSSTSTVQCPGLCRLSAVSKQSSGFVILMMIKCFDNIDGDDEDDNDRLIRSA